MSNDPPRLLAQRSEHGYTNRPHEALRHEPEAIPAGYQHHITEQARQTGTRRRRDSFGHRRAELEAELTGLTTAGMLSSSDTRLLRRELERLDRRIA